MKPSKQRSANTQRRILATTAAAAVGLSALLWAQNPVQVVDDENAYNLLPQRKVNPIIRIRDVGRTDTPTESVELPPAPAIPSPQRQAASATPPPAATQPSGDLPTLKEGISNLFGPLFSSDGNAVPQPRVIDPKPDLPSRTVEGTPPRILGQRRMGTAPGSRAIRYWDAPDLTPEPVPVPDPEPEPEPVEEPAPLLPPPPAPPPPAPVITPPPPLPPVTLPPAPEPVREGIDDEQMRKYMDAGMDTLSREQSEMDERLKTLETAKAENNDNMIAYIDSGWNVLIDEQEKLHGRMDDVETEQAMQGARIDYLATGLSTLATGQDENSMQIGENKDMIEQVRDEHDKRITKNADDIQDLNDRVGNHGQRIEDLEFGHLEQGEAIDMLDERQNYLEEMLNSIIVNPDEFMFWSGYLADEGPPPLRFAEAPEEFDRRNLIPLNSGNDSLSSTYTGEQLDDGSLDIDMPTRRYEPLQRPDYQGNYNELTADQIRRLLQSGNRPGDDLPVDFVTPHQNKPKQLDSPGAETLY